jgi:hypothetical protein
MGRTRIAQQRRVPRGCRRQRQEVSLRRCTGLEFPVQQRRRRGYRDPSRAERIDRDQPDRSN